MRLRFLFESRRFVLAFLACAFAPCASAQLAAEHWLGVAKQLAPAGTPTLDFTPHGTQPGLIYDIQPPEPQCSACHATAGGDPPTSAEFRPFSAWAGSMMANATRDPLFFAALDIANNDFAGVGDYCLRCHTPRGWLMGHVVKSGFGDPPNDQTTGAAACLLNGTYDAPDDINSDMGGVTCHFCHRMMPNGPNGEPGYTDSGNAWVDDLSCANTGGGPPCRRGPYAYTDGTAPPPHEWMYSEYHTESAICGTCHNVTSPDTTAFAVERIFTDGFDGGSPLKTLKLNDGTNTGHPFPIERTFSEWQQSQYGQPPETTCQNCHMPESEDPDATACSYRINNRTGNLPVHAFVGGNTWVPGIILGEYGAGLDSSGTGRSQSLAQTIDWARALLGTAASLDTTIQSYTPPTSSSPGSMAVQVVVTNLTGHKLPTGYAEGRRMWLDVQVRDADGGLVFESGAYDSTNAVLTQDAQARVYETLQGIWNNLGSGACDVEDGGGAPVFHFILNDCIAKDSRIPPLGFTPATATDPNGYDLRPVGAISYPETSAGSGVLVNYDTAPYTLTIPAGTATPLTATARLYYQTASNDYMAFLRNEATDNSFPAENNLCTGGPDRPFIVGPQDRTRGEYAFELWNNAPDDTQQPGYGKSPPELMQTGSATTSH